MVNEYEKTDSRLLEIFEEFKKEEMAGKKRFYIDDLKQYIINKTGGVREYAVLGGYQGLYQLIKYKEKEEKIIPIKSSELNARSPVLKTRWQLIDEREQSWEDKTVFRLANKLDISYFLKRPELQTEKLLNRIKEIYQFLANKKEREWASREERSLELFGDEKFLTSSQGKRFLSRLKIDLSDIKAEKFHQMFVYWRRKSEIKEILILENHSAFITCKRALFDGYSIFSRRPDTLIYGAGNHITKSLEFLEEITNTARLDIYYAGDLDPSGLAIYYYLRENYPYYNLNLFVDYYEKMLKLAENGYQIQTDQNKRDVVLNCICREIEKDAVKQVEKLWNNNMRIPQEVITYEVIKKDNS